MAISTQSLCPSRFTESSCCCVKLIASAVTIIFSPLLDPSRLVIINSWSCGWVTPSRRWTRLYWCPTSGQQGLGFFCCTDSALACRYFSLPGRISFPSWRAGFSTPTQIGSSSGCGPYKARFHFHCTGEEGQTMANEWALSMRAFLC